MEQETERLNRYISYLQDKIKISGWHYNRYEQWCEVNDKRIVYWRIKESKRQYRGERYFKVSADSEMVDVICIDSGEVKKGRQKSDGISQIKRASFEQNY